MNEIEEVKQTRLDSQLMLCKAEYLYNDKFPDIKELAKSHGVPLVLLEQYIRDENWNMLRNAEQEMAITQSKQELRHRAFKENTRSIDVLSAIRNVGAKQLLGQMKDNKYSPTINEIKNISIAISDISENILGNGKKTQEGSSVINNKILNVNVTQAQLGQMPLEKLKELNNTIITAVESNEDVEMED